MPYKTNNELPKAVSDHLSKHAQDIYRKAFNNALEEYKEPSKKRDNASVEEIAHKVAWTAVKAKYHKNKATGHWEEN